MVRGSLTRACLSEAHSFSAIDGLVSVAVPDLATELKLPWGRQARRQNRAAPLLRQYHMKS
jgi:hypothetical protein